MDGLTAAHERMEHRRSAHGDSGRRHAPMDSFFCTPFEDGNGRIHRFLIHNILARQGFTPEGVMFPISAPMLKNPRRL